MTAEKCSVTFWRPKNALNRDSKDRCSEEMVEKLIHFSSQHRWRLLSDVCRFPPLPNILAKWTPISTLPLSTWPQHQIPQAEGSILTVPPPTSAARVVLPVLVISQLIALGFPQTPFWVQLICLSSSQELRAL